ncbi:hypothetical protein WJC97_005332 [Klebsiella pneumoniae]|uniref:hypothetical protein n=1 Tax=Klebsiella pneumoniae TaxID=573 RepID=UPI0006667FB5|nr:hypothetical protein [Klebsiella pneumoniae]
MAQITDERLAKILAETQKAIMEHNARCESGTVKVNARLIESILMELQYRRKSSDLESSTVTVKLPQRLQPGADGWDDWYVHSDDEGEYLKFDDVLAMLTAAGIKVEAE